MKIRLKEAMGFMPEVKNPSLSHGVVLDRGRESWSGVPVGHRAARKRYAISGQTWV